MHEPISNTPRLENPDSNIKMETTLELFDDIPQHLEGDMSVPSQTRNTSQPGAPDFNTLDEPIKDTILRDVRAVGVKFYHVLYPKERASLLRDWDLWGPLVLCTFMATFLQGSSSNSINDGGPEFAQVFVMVWVGAGIVTLNSKLLGGNISFFQSVCVIGYCLTPLALSLILCRVILLGTQTDLTLIFRLLASLGGFLWATYASYVFLGDSHSSSRKALAVYPMSLFFFIMSWLVLCNN